MLLNADLGESWKDRAVGNDAALMPLLDRCNLACGFHGGDALTMVRTIELAAEHGVGVGAHPSFPDRKNFGRKRMELPLEELAALIEYQVSALMGMVEARHGRLTHVKPHGALYHYLNEQPAAAKRFVAVVESLGIDEVFGPPEGALRGAVAGSRLRFVSEGFADRRYDYGTVSTREGGSPAASSPTLHLRPRRQPGATLEQPDEAAAQVRRMIEDGTVVAGNHKPHPLVVDTVCLHGDHPGAYARARAVRAAIDELTAP